MIRRHIHKLPDGSEAYTEAPEGTAIEIVGAAEVTEIKTSRDEWLAMVAQRRDDRRNKHKPNNDTLIPEQGNPTNDKLR